MVPAVLQMLVWVASGGGAGAFAAVLEITTTALPEGTVGKFYSHQLILLSSDLREQHVIQRERIGS